jgi:hypothetical protein
MAIFQPGAPDPSGTVNEGILYTTPVNGPPVMQRANNNRSVRKGPLGRASSASSASFLNLNQAIVNLDAGYELLPDKTPWVLYAVAIAGQWQLCANCAPDAGGKKLYRQYNFNRGLISLPVISVPIDPTATAASTALNIFVETLDGGATYTVTIDGIPPIVPCYVVANVGRSLGNPVWLIDATQMNTGITAGSGYVWAMAITEALGLIGRPDGDYPLFIRCCYFDINGAPGINESNEYLLHVFG